jgi:dynein heavy chain
VYKQPAETNIDGYRSIINRFPDFEKPEVFGMNENANITFKLTESKMALNTMLSIQPRDTVPGD